jgi:hypothetical protein
MNIVYIYIFGFMYTPKWDWLLFYRIDRNVSFFQSQKIQNLDAIEKYRLFLN